MDAKKIFFKGNAFSTALIGLETRNSGVNERRRLNEVDMRCLKRLCEVFRIDRVKNEVIRKTNETRKL